MEITAENLIPPKRLRSLCSKAIERLEEKDPDMSKKIKAIKKRSGLKTAHGIEISTDARKYLTVKCSQLVVDMLKKGINVTYIKGKGVRITEETLRQAEELK